MTINLLFSELVGFTAGGIVTAGYLALFTDQWARILGTLTIAGITWGAVHLIGLWIALFGRRRFVITMLVSFLLGWVWEGTITMIPYSTTELRVIGFIVPGLIANDFSRQGVPETLSALAVVTVATRLVVMIFHPGMM